MKKVSFVVLVCVLCLVMVIPGIAQEKKVWGKRNIWAKELTEHLTHLYEGLTQLVEKGLNEELGDPDFLGKMKEEMKERFHPELIPEGHAEVEQFATDFISYIIDTYQKLKSEWLAEESFIEEIKKITIENMSSWSRCPYALRPKLFEGWRIQALSPVYLGVSLGERTDEEILIRSFDPQGPLFKDGEIYELKNGTKQLLGKIRELTRYGGESVFAEGKVVENDIAMVILKVNDQSSPKKIEQFMPFLDEIMWKLYPGDIVTLSVHVQSGYVSYPNHSGRYLLTVPLAKRDKWLVLPES